MLQVGEHAPDFSLPDDTGRTISLSELLAHGPVVLMFYPADGTPLCTKEACMVRDAFEGLSRAGVTVVGISRQGQASKQAFRAAHGLRHVLLADEDGAVAKLYGVRGIFGLPVPVGTLRVSFLVGRDGSIRERVDSEFSLSAHERLLERASAMAS